MGALLNLVEQLPIVQTQSFLMISALVYKAHPYLLPITTQQIAKKNLIVVCSFFKMENIVQIAQSVPVVINASKEKTDQVISMLRKGWQRKKRCQGPIPGMGFEPMCAYAHWILSPTP